MSCRKVVKPSNKRDGDREKETNTLDNPETIDYLLKTERGKVAALKLETTMSTKTAPTPIDFARIAALPVEEQATELAKIVAANTEYQKAVRKELVSTSSSKKTEKRSVLNDLREQFEMLETPTTAVAIHLSENDKTGRIMTGVKVRVPGVGSGSLDFYVSTKTVKAKDRPAMVEACQRAALIAANALAAEYGTSDSDDDGEE